MLGTLQVLPIFAGRLRIDRLSALAHRALDDCFADRRDVQADTLFEESKETRVVAHTLSSAENSTVRTSSVSNSLTPIHCIKPRASSRTGPK